MLKIYWQRIRHNKLAAAGLVIITVLTLAALLSSFVAPYDPVGQNISARLQGPGAAHYLGTDDLGRDVFSRMLYGSRISLSIGIIAVGIAVLIGTAIGIISGYFGGKIDSLLMRLVDIVLCFPTFFLILLVIAFLEPSIYNVMIVIGLTSWPGLARLVRAQVLTIRTREFVQAAELIGTSRLKIFFIHLLPNTISPIIVSATLGVGDAILTESGLSFLGLGVQPPMPSWGQMLTLGKDYIHMAWWLSLFPGLAILATVLGFNLLGEGLRDALDPRIND
ncbi:MAG TPA: peptide ABC transporter permease [Elusimicrobia bacterium]|nr:MAG: peptide ABC transporter permease [Elusimicrobia bacterium RIFOXYA12_FULL_49_49]OGS10047.1 MAG: peptide ABC transporter permease [Elusimicrobia bacterium RIFOXYA1_FULL_47_7]OGS10589.1 MAG: peptide ABC transporter permease [Elusimicrobia bacterium RIFOXYB1_FULL_48_9]OGS16063.1 MAG: peptide ABC transporter permease [Elusimicrobia bacterium RIFOXYA2_FULL_47_53]OGS26689.1 MAG: peptide ABC transporter permease [Elusimicrobia bacterium RIFOXYB12_FULL_50_12]OGS30185.1 MAG: peptide ABC transpor